CSGGSSSCAGVGPRRTGTGSGSFLRSTGSPAGADDGGIDEPQFAAQSAVPLQVDQQMREDPGPRAVTGPAPEATVDRLPGAVALRDVAPGRPRVEAPQDAVEDAPMVLPRSTAPILMGRVREEPLDALPLHLRKFITSSHGRPPGANIPTRNDRIAPSL